MHEKPKPIEVNSVSNLRKQASQATSWANRIGRDPTPPFATPAAPASAPVDTDNIPLVVTHEDMRQKNRTHHPDFNFTKSGVGVGPAPAPARAPVETE